MDIEKIIGAIRREASRRAKDKTLDEAARRLAGNINKDIVRYKDILDALPIDMESDLVLLFHSIYAAGATGMASPLASNTARTVSKKDGSKGGLSSGNARRLKAEEGWIKEARRMIIDLMDKGYTGSRKQLAKKVTDAWSKEGFMPGDASVERLLKSMEADRTISSAYRE